jgi:hypothetical protein
VMAASAESATATTRARSSLADSINASDPLNTGGSGRIKDSDALKGR